MFVVAYSSNLTYSTGTYLYSYCTLGFAADNAIEKMPVDVQEVVPIIHSLKQLP